MAWDFKIRLLVGANNNLNIILNVILIQQFFLLLFISTNFKSVGSFQFNCDSLNEQNNGSCNCDTSIESSTWDIECPRGLVDVHDITIKVKSLNDTSAYLNVVCNAYHSDLEMAWRMLKGLDFSEQESKFNVTGLSINKCPLSVSTNTLNDFFAQVKLHTSSITSFTFLPARNSTNFDANFESLSNFIISLENLETLELKTNKLTKIPKLINLYKLQLLSLMSNEIMQLSPEVFNSTTNLKLIDLGFNKIEIIPDGIFPDSLRRIFLQNNNISNITENTFSNLKNLEYLILRNNPLTHLNPNAFLELHELKTLDLYSTYFKKFPILKNLSKLEIIILSYRDHHSKNNNNDNDTISGTETLPIDFNGSIENLPNLLELTLTSIGLNTFPILQNLPKLTKLNIDKNKIKEILKNSFHGLISLTSLDLSQNKIEHLIEINAINLIELNISQNQLKNLSANVFLALTRLTTLKLNKNMIEHIHSKTFESLTNLKYLDLSENKISTLSHLQILPSPPDGKPEDVFVAEFGQQSVLRFCLKLEKLYLSKNNINEIYEDWKLLMSKLKILDMSHNKVEKLYVFDINFFSRELKLDLSYNKISSVIMDHADYLLDGAENRVLDIKLDYNPLNCDCNQLAFKKFNLKGVNFIYKNLSCNEPNNLKDIQFREVISTELICSLNVSFGCPTICSCWKVPGNKTIVVDCSFRNLSDIIPSVHGLRLNGSRGYNVSLNLAGNGISDLNENKTKNISKHVTQIDLSENELVDLSIFSLLSSNNDTLFYFAENKFLCSNCEFHKTLRKHFKQIPDYKNVTCLSEENDNDGHIIRWLVDEIPESQICQQQEIISSTELKVLVIAVGIITVCIVLLIAVYIRHGWALRALLYSKGIGCCLIMEDDSFDENEKIYDAFISFSHKDEEWVLTQLVNRLEEQEGFKLCLHFRDWTPGDWIPDQIVRSVDKSRRTVVILSKNFVESIWSRLEFKAAHSQALNEKGNRLILILMGEDLADNDVQDDDLKVYMKMNTYLKWGDPWFWHKLKYALPHKKSISVQNHFIKQQQRDRAIQLDKLRTKMENSVV